MAQSEVEVSDEFSPVSNEVCVIKNCYKYKGIVLEQFCHKDVIPAIKEMAVNADDTFIVSYPRTGTTWTERILACLLEGLDNGSFVDVEARFPFIEFIQPEEPDLPLYNGLELAKQQQSPRFLKTHLPFTLLPDDLKNKGKIVFITRDPLDTLISHFHFYQNMSWIKYNGSLDAMYNAYLAGEHPYGGYFKWYGDWGEALSEIPASQVHFINFEKMKADPKGEISKMAKFIGKEISAEEIAQIAEISSFDHMKKSTNIPGIPNFIRSGKIGEGKSNLNFQQREEMQKAMAALKQKAPRLPLSDY